MAVTIVTAKRRFNIDPITNEATKVFQIFFDAFTSHEQMSMECLGAVDPNTSLTTPSVEGEKLDSVRYPNAVVEDFDIHPEPGQNLIWEMRVSYGEVDRPESDVADFTFDRYPWQMPKKYSWGHFFDQSVLINDVENNPILNSSKDRLDEDIIIDRTIRTFDVDFNLPLGAVNGRTTGSYINTINKGGMQIEGEKFDDKTIRCMFYNATTELATVTIGTTQKEVPFRKVTAQLAYDPLTWEGYYLDIGNKGKDKAGADIRRFTDKDGNPYNHPLRMNGGGIRLIKKDGTPNGIAAAANVDNIRSIAGVAVFLKYKRYKEINLNVLGV